MNVAACGVRCAPQSEAFKLHTIGVHDMATLDTFDFEYKGRRFRANVEHDDTQDAPWDAEDGHGDVTEWTSRAKLPGELVLAADRRFHKYRYYDFAGAVRTARRDGWDAAPYRDGETRGQRAHKAAWADYKRLKAWCDDEWTYVGVVVQALDADGECVGETASLWGIESDADDYLHEVAQELAAEVYKAA